MRSSPLAPWRISAACALALAATAAQGAEEAAQSPGSSLQELLGLSGSVRAAQYSKDQSFRDQSGYAATSVWVTLTPPEFLKVRAYFDGRVQTQDFTRRAMTRFDLREGYAQTSFGSLDVRLGRQIIVWGRADKVNPTDVWSTRDFTLLAPDDDDQRLGVASMLATWNTAAYRVIGLWQPKWRTPALPTPPLPAGVTLQNVRPPHPAEQWGFKLDHSGGGIDWSVSWSRSIDRTPDLALLSGVSALPLGLAYQPVTTLGGDAAVPVGQYGLRAEIAYTRTQDAHDSDPFTKNRNLFLVLGAERTYYGELNFNVQALYRHTFGWSAPTGDPTRQLLAAQVDLLSNQLASDMPGASLRVNYKAWNETLESEIAAVAWAKKGDCAVFPKIRYAFTDRIKGVMGANLYHGPAQSFFGRLHRTSSAYVELRVGF
jgi:hypothetical protein